MEEINLQEVDPEDQYVSPNRIQPDQTQQVNNNNYVQQNRFASAESGSQDAIAADISVVNQDLEKLKQQSNKIEISNIDINNEGCVTIARNDGFSILAGNSLSGVFRGVGEVAIVKILGSTNIIAFVGAENNPKFRTNQVILWDDSENQVVGTIDCESKVLDIKLCRPMNAIIVILQTVTNVYNIVNLQLITSIQTLDNSKGLCECDVNNLNGAIVTIGTQKGHLQVVYPFVQNKPSTTIYVNDENYPIIKMAMNRDGRLLAVVYGDGSSISVYLIPSVDDIKKKTDLTSVTHNGLSYPRYYATRVKGMGYLNNDQEVYWMGFTNDSNWVCTCGSTETVHLFSLKAQKYTAGAIGSLVYDTSSQGSTIRLKLPSSLDKIKHSVCYITAQMVYVICSNGFVYKFNVDLSELTKYLEVSPASFTCYLSLSPYFSF